MYIYYSPAKINLLFHVKKKRSDGFHEIFSLMQAINLKDVLHFRISKTDSFKCSEKSLETKDNLVLKALHLFRQKTKISTPLNIFLEKNIPLEAGLGGGSSNAATALWALSKVFCCDISNEILMRWAKELGSDVPFFFSYGTALCKGRGEKVQNVEYLLNQKITIFKPSFGISTEKVYTNLSEISPLEDAFLLDSLKKENDNFFNDLEKPAFEIEPRLKKVKEKLISHGFSKVVMTGSGSAFFCLGASKSSPQGLSSFSCSTIFRHQNSWY